jgi:hypothetical protein
MKNKVFKNITIICFALMLLLDIISLITAISSSGFFAISLHGSATPGVYANARSWRV